MTRGAIGLEFLNLGAPIPNFTRYQGAFALDPCRGTRQRMLKTGYVALPIAKVEIEIMLPISFRRRRCYRLNRLQGDYQAAHSCEGHRAFHWSLEEHSAPDVIEASRQQTTVMRITFQDRIG
jgi:hypothetical protein